MRRNPTRLLTSSSLRGLIPPGQGPTAQISTATLVSLVDAAAAAIYAVEAEALDHAAAELRQFADRQRGAGVPYVHGLEDAAAHVEAMAAGLRARQGGTE